MEEEAQPLVAVPRALVEHKLEAGGRMESFNKVLLAYFYKHLFPFRQMHRWMAYGNDPASTAPLNKPDFFHRREFTFTLEGDVFVRYLCFKNAEEFKAAVIARQPERIEIGPVYTATPDMNKVLRKDVFKAEERELIFDLDMNDYDDVRTCCTGASVCKKCWAFINVAVKVLNNTLREDFGFQHLLFVFSGRRGMHVWVSDESARKLTDEQRSAVLGFVNIFSGDGASAGAGYQESAAPSSSSSSSSSSGGGVREQKHIVGFNRVMNGLTAPLHPSLHRAFLELEGVFVRLIIPSAGQGLLATPERWAKVLDFLPTLPAELGINLRGVIEGAWAKASSPEKRWSQLVTTVGGLITKAGGPLAAGGAAGKAELTLPRPLRRNLEKLIPAIVFTFTYPRLDVEVSKHRNHLLKAPFCIHPKTGKICVPISVASVEDFDPNAVPTCGGLMGEGNAWLAGGGGGKAGAAGGSSSSSSSSSASAGGGAPAEEGKSELWRHTSLNRYVLEFEEFLAGIQAASNRARRQASEGRSVMGGEEAW